MCDWNLIEFSCGHTQPIAGRWCPEYYKSGRRCPVHYTHFEYRADEVCSPCRPKTQPAWMSHMQQHRPRTGQHRQHETY